MIYYILFQLFYILWIIKNWYYNGNEKFLTIETIPFNLNIIFRDIILSITKDKGKVLYISGLAKAEVIEDLSITDKSTNYQIIKVNLDILLYSELYNIADKYDLIIFKSDSNAPIVVFFKSEKFRFKKSHSCDLYGIRYLYLHSKNII